jgi:hypothetical protein
VLEEDITPILRGTHLGDIDKNLSGGIVQLDTLENISPVVGNLNLSSGSRLKVLVHDFQTQSSFHHVANRENTDERARGKTRLIQRGLL